MDDVITLVIADDHEIYRDGLRLMLSRQKGVRLVGEAENGRQLVALACRLKPDVVLTDIRMPVMDGIAATLELSKCMPGLKVIALSMFDEEALIMDMIEAGASGYLLKNADKQEIMDALRTVSDGGNYYCRHIASTLAGLVSKSKAAAARKNAAVVFTDRELEVIRLICRQLTAQEIADNLHLSKRTVEGHRARVIEKMDVKNTAGIVIYALKHELVTEQELNGHDDSQDASTG